MNADIAVTTNGTLDPSATSALVASAAVAQHFVNESLAAATGCTAELSFGLNLESVPVNAAETEERSSAGGQGDTDLLILYPPPPPSPPSLPPYSPPRPPLTPYGGVIEQLTGITGLAGLLGGRGAATPTGNASSEAGGVGSAGSDGDGGGEPARLNATRQQVNAVLDQGVRAWSDRIQRRGGILRASTACEALPFHPRALPFDPRLCRPMR